MFNNAGIGGAGSFVDDDREAWERTFNVDWGGVYLSSRVFLPMLVAADEGHIVNTSSINGILASVGPSLPHTAYSAAKFAVRGFSEALITDLRLNAPHVRVSVVMPGHVGTSIVINSGIAHGKEPDNLTTEDIDTIRRRMAAGGTPLDDVADEDVRKGVAMMGEMFRDQAPLSAADAAQIILDGVRANQWRILVGDDAILADEMVRADPEHAYEPEFWAALQSKGEFGGFLERRGLSGLAFERSPPNREGPWSSRARQRSSPEGRAASGSRPRASSPASGANLVLGDIEEEPLSAAVEGAARRRRQGHRRRGDVSKEADVVAMRDAALERVRCGARGVQQRGRRRRADDRHAQEGVGLGAGRERRRRHQRHQRLRAALPRAERGPRRQHGFASRGSSAVPAWAPTARASSRSSGSPSRSSTSWR